MSYHGNIIVTRVLTSFVSDINMCINHRVFIIVPSYTDQVRSATAVLGLYDLISDFRYFVQSYL